MSFILLQNEEGEDIDRTVYHELTHHFARNTASSLPLWFSEGLADFYSTFKTSGDEVHIGRPVTEHVQWLRNEKLIPLSELFNVTVDSPAYNEEDRRGVFYAQSWALVHYLMKGSPERKASLGRFLDLLAAGKAVDAAFAESFKLTYAEVEKELRAYVHRYTFSYTKYSLSDSKVRNPERPVPMTRDALLYELGHLYAWTGNQEVASRFLLQLYAEAGRAEEASRLLNVVARGSDGQMVKHAKEALNFADVRKAEALARSGKNDEAIALAGSLLARTTEAQLKEYLRTFIAELREMEATKKAIDALDRAISSANSGKHAEALAILNEAIPTVTHPEVLAEMEKIRSRLQSRKKKK